MMILAFRYFCYLYDTNTNTNTISPIRHTFHTPFRSVPHHHHHHHHHTVYPWMDILDLIWFLIPSTVTIILSSINAKRSRPKEEGKTFRKCKTHINLAHSIYVSVTLHTHTRTHTNIHSISSIFSPHVFFAIFPLFFLHFRVCSGIGINDSRQVHQQFHFQSRYFRCFFSLSLSPWWAVLSIFFTCCQKIFLDIACVVFPPLQANRLFPINGSTLFVCALHSWNFIFIFF